MHLGFFYISKLTLHLCTMCILLFFSYSDMPCFIINSASLIVLLQNKWINWRLHANSPAAYHLNSCFFFFIWIVFFFIWILLYSKIPFLTLVTINTICFLHLIQTMCALIFMSIKVNNNCIPSFTSNLTTEPQE